MEASLKYRLVEKLIQTEDDNILNEIKLLLGLNDTDFWSELPDHVKSSVNLAKSQLEKGEGVANDTLFKEIRKRHI